MRLKNILIAVTDMERSKEFYHSLFGLPLNSILKIKRLINLLRN